MSSQSGSSKVKKTARILGFALVVLLLLLIVATIAIQFPVVQNSLVKTYTKRLSRQLNSDVHIGSIDLKFFDKLQVNDFRIISPENDTILIGDKLVMDYNLQAILGKAQLAIDHIHFDHATVNLSKDENGISVFQYIVDHYTKPPEELTQEGTDPKKNEQKKSRVKIDETLVSFADSRIISRNKANHSDLDVRLENANLVLSKASEDSIWTIHQANVLFPIVLVEKHKHPEGTSSTTTVETAGIDTSLLNQLDSKGGGLPLFVENLEIEGGTFTIQDNRQPSKIFRSDVIDWKNLHATNVDLSFKNVHWPHLEKANGELVGLAFNHPSGFILEEFSSKNFVFNDTELSFEEALIKTPNSTLKESISMRYQDFPAFLDFENDVRLDLGLNNSFLHIRDLLHISQGLHKNTFFVENQNEKILLNGRVTGTVNSFRSRYLDLSIHNKIKITGEIAIKNVTVPGEQLLNLDLSEAVIGMKDLRQIVPGFSMPDHFDRLGLLRYNGRYDGFFSDFVAFGTLLSDLGKVELDMRLDTKKGKDVATYSGQIELEDFDLQKWTLNPKLGHINLFARVDEGRGLTLETAEANLEAKLYNLQFNDYLYQDAFLDGIISKNQFEGLLDIQDDHVQLGFNGFMTFEEKPQLNCKANIKLIDLQKIGFAQDVAKISGDFDMNAKIYDAYNLEGHVLSENLRLSIKDDQIQLDSIFVFSSVENPDRKQLNLQTKFMKGSLEGKYEIQEVPYLINEFIIRHYPIVAKRIAKSDLRAPDQIHAQDFKFEVEILHADPFRELIHIDNLYAIGEFTSDTNLNLTYTGEGRVDQLEVSNFELRAADLFIQGDKNESTASIETEYMSSGSLTFDQNRFDFTLHPEDISFDVQSDSIIDQFTSASFIGNAQIHDSTFEFHLDESHFDFLGDKWAVIPGNFVQFNNSFFASKNLAFVTNNASYITLNASKDQSAQLEISGLPISFMDEVLDFNDFRFKGLFSANIDFARFLKSRDLTFNIRVDSFHINDDLFGDLLLDGEWPTGQPLQYDLSLGVNDQSLESSGFVQYEDSLMDYRFATTVSDYPIDIAEYFIGSMISNTTGIFDADFVIENRNSKAAIDGTCKLSGGTRINYLGVTYFLADQVVNISPTLFDFSGNILTDTDGNEAIITGGITHNHFKKFGLNARMDSDRFTILNTTKQDNDTYYGTGVGEIVVQFDGDFKRTSIDIKGVTRSGSILYIPIGDSNFGGQGKFVTFNIDSDVADLEQRSVEITGTDISMLLDINESAEVQIIFDEQTGEIIKSVGTGSMNINVNRSGDFTMNGYYEISSGEYLYTLFRYINKPFLLEEGGRLSWDGDPYNAVIDIDARYSGLKTSVRNLIYEQLNTNSFDEQLVEAASRPTRVDLILNLTGNMNEPEIAFDLQFPDLDPSIRNLTESQIRIIQEDESEFNRQVGGLLILNSFLPPSLNINLTATTLNTLTEFLSSQISNIFTSLLSDAFDDVSYISGVDIQFDFNYFNQDLITDQTSVVGWEFELDPSIRFFDDQLTVRPGVSLTEGTIYTGSSFIAPNIAIEFYPTKDRRWRLRVFNRTYSSIDGTSNKTGFGLLFRKEYDSLAEIFQSDNAVKKKVTKNKDVNTASDALQSTSSNH